MLSIAVCELQRIAVDASFNFRFKMLNELINFGIRYILIDIVTRFLFDSFSRFLISPHNKNLII